MVVARIRFIAVVRPARYREILPEEQTDKTVLERRIAAFRIQREPRFLDIDARRVVRVQVEGIRKRCDDDIGIRRLIRKDPGFHRDLQRGTDGVQIFQYAH